MKTQHFKLSRLQSAFAGAVAAVGVAGLGALAQAAVAPAGDPITNQATVTYEDTVGNPYNASSNSATVTVAQVFNATISQDSLNSVAGPAQTVYTTHTITNNGNGEDIFHVTVAQDAATSTDTADFDSLAVFLDGSATASAGTVTTNDCSGTNGQVDPGEVLLANTTTLSNTITIPAGQTACIVVEAQVPATALDGETYELTVTAEAENGNAGAPQTNSVADITDGNATIGGGTNGVDGLDGTNNDRVTITADAALQINKTAIHTPATATSNGSIAYTIQVSNTGAASANELYIFDGIPANTVLLPGSVLFNGAATASGDDTLQITATDITEANIDALVAANVNATDLNGDGDSLDVTETDLGIDVDTDGSTDGVTNQGVFVYDHSLPANTTVTLQFTVTYSNTLAGGSVINNFAYLSSDSNDDGDSEDPGETNSAGPAPITIPTIRSVDIDDTGDGALGNNDGTDEDATDDPDNNDVQSVQSAAEGSTVVFNNILTNNGNAPDDLVVTVNGADGGLAWFNGPDGLSSTADDATAYPTPLAGVIGSLSCDGTAARGFPVGTTFAVANASGVPFPGGLVANIAAGASVNITVTATLPAGTNGVGEYCASTQVVSVNDASAVDYKLERLGEITPPAVDLANTNNSALAGDTEPFPSVDGIALGSPVLTQVGNPGDVVTFPLFIRNDGGTGESFTLASGGTWNGGAQADATFAAGVLGPIPAGWSVVFQDNDPATATPDGTVITSTDTIPAGSAIQVLVEVTIPATATDSQANFVSDIDGGAGNDPIDGNGDGDNDYPFIFQITGNSSGSVDVILDAVDVNEVEAIVVAPDQTGQVEPGGTITYAHTVSNNGNTTEAVVITVVDDRDGDGAEPNDFNSSIIRVDTTCDGVVDTVLTAVTGTTNNVCLAGDAASTPTGDYNSGTGELTMGPGDQVAIEVTVSSRTSAPTSVINTTTVTATWDAGADSETATDQTTVVTVQLRAVKTVALDAACDGTPDTAFAATSIADAAPGECVIWQIVVENQSSQAARNVLIQDAAPAFTTYEAGTPAGTVGSMESCVGDAGVAASDIATACPGVVCALTDAQDTDAACASTHDAHTNGTDVFFYVGQADGANPAPDGSTIGAEIGGTLSPGEFVTVRFRVLVDPS